MTKVNKTDVVRKGDSPWKVAVRSLGNNNGQQVTNSDIIKEMNRLAKLNGCNDVEDFNNKFFLFTGKEFVINESDATPTPTPKLTIQEKKPQKRIVQKKITKTPVKVSKATEQQIHANRINRMASDEQRIIEHNKTNYTGEYYGIVDKKTCQLKIYDKDGNVVKTFTVGVGKNIGDNLQSYYNDRANKTKDAAKAEQGRYTTAGEFTLDEVTEAVDAYTGKDGKPKIMNLKGDNRGYHSGQMALHMLYKPQYAQREAAIRSKGLEDNRMSYGCVNLTEEDWNLMHQYLGEGDKLYVLPEEKGNKLQLEKQKDGTYKFEQVYHKNDKRDYTKEQASRLIYDVRPERDPRRIAQQNAKKNNNSLAQASKPKQEVHWYNPLTWFS